MEVRVFNEAGNLIWSRGNMPVPHGQSCTTYAVDGTLNAIETALEDALMQAKSEQLIADDVDAVPNRCATTA